MNEIKSKGNLPWHLQLFAKQLGGAHQGVTTKFFEFNNIDEFEKTAAGKADPDIKFEITPAMDQKTDRYYLAGFEVDEPKKITTLNLYSNMYIYFIELSKEEFKKWANRIINDRKLQEKEMIDRRERIKNSRELKRKLGVKE